jgi:hypothetical protein
MGQFRLMATGAQRSRLSHAEWGMGIPYHGGGGSQVSRRLDQLSRKALTTDSIDVEIAYLSRALSMLPSLSSLWLPGTRLCSRRDRTCIPSFYAHALTKGQFDTPCRNNLGFAEQPHGSWAPSLCLLPCSPARRQCQIYESMMLSGKKCSHLLTCLISSVPFLYLLGFSSCQPRVT